MMRNVLLGSACCLVAVSAWAQSPLDENHYAAPEVIQIAAAALPVPHLVLQSPAAPGHHRQASSAVAGQHAQGSHYQAEHASAQHAPAAGHFPHNAMVAGDVAGHAAHPAQTGHESINPIEKVGEHFLHADKRTPPPAIPNAVRVPVWKTPYSYGYFGASRTRHWSRHHGHQQGYTQWSLK